LQLNMELIDRTSYTDKVIDYLGKGSIIVLTGQRRVGKSCILQCVRRRIEAADSHSNVIYINKEYSEFAQIRTSDDLDSFVSSRLKAGRRNYLLIDEVQEIDHFENSLRSLQAKDECEIVITGSNAKMLSSELATYLSGRYIEMHIHSLDYDEFLLFHHLDDNDDAVRLYLSFGGLPQLAMIGLDNRQMTDDYLRDVYTTVVMKDVISRENIRNVRLLQDLAAFLSDNIGKNISANSLAKYLKSQSVNVSPAVIINYLSFFVNAYVVDRVARYDIHGKRLFETNEKYYFEDLGIRNSLVGTNLRRDIEKLMENAVYLRLVRDGFAVNVGQLQNGEIDFVANKGSERLYVQVAYMLQSPDTEQREFGNLMAINDNYPKLVVSMDPMAGYGDYNGIETIQLRNFLKTKA